MSRAAGGSSAQAYRSASVAEALSACGWKVKPGARTQRPILRHIDQGIRAEQSLCPTRTKHAVAQAQTFQACWVANTENPKCWLGTAAVLRVGAFCGRRRTLRRCSRNRGGPAIRLWPPLQMWQATEHTVTHRECNRPGAKEQRRRRSTARPSGKGAASVRHVGLGYATRLAPL